MMAKPMKTLQLHYPIMELCYPTEMAIRLKIAFVVSLVLFMLVADVRCYGDSKYGKLEARVKNLEDALRDIDLECKRKATSLSKHISKQSSIICFSLNFVSVCSGDVQCKKILRRLHKLETF